MHIRKQSEQFLKMNWFIYWIWYTHSTHYLCDSVKVKRNVNKINMEETKDRFANIRSHFRGYKVNFIPLSLEDMWFDKQQEQYIWKSTIYSAIAELYSTFYGRQQAYSSYHEQRIADYSWLLPFVIPHSRFNRLQESDVDLLRAK